MSTSEPMPVNTSAFPETPWTALFLARGSDTVGSDALSHLCELYWYPVYVYIRRRGHSAHDAEDLTQSFFEDFLKRRDFSSVDRVKGRLRSFLATSVSHFLSQNQRKEMAQKRGGNHFVFSIDGAQAEEKYRFEPVEELDPERLFERRWALTTLENVLGELGAEYRGQGKGPVFDALSGFLTGKPSAAGYAATGAAIGLSEDSIKMAVHRLRKRYGIFLRRHIALTVESEAEVEEEIRWMIGTFQG